MSPNRRLMAGVSLIELMVSLVIGTLISAVFSAWQLMVEVGQDDQAAA